MENQLFMMTALVILLPLFGSLIAGLIGKKIGSFATSWVTIALVAVSFLISTYLFYLMVFLNHPTVEVTYYAWITSGLFKFDIAVLLDRLSATMIFIVTFVSLMVHVYTVGYMEKDPGYERFFSYVSLFTFAMLVLVLANNFLLLFFGWEGVGLVSYLLIGFWFKRESAIFGSLKAFLVNRVSDVGFILAIAGVLTYFNSLNYLEVFQHVPDIFGQSIHVFPGMESPAITVICILLFFGAMGKSAQVPLHVWLPESMEGPTPISALIHAATMVTAGIYMVARMSPLFEYSPITLSFIVTIGAITAFFMGILAISHFDIKRVIAYSTLSQLGYMTVALGISAFDAAIFHLVTHAFFKALLFLAAGSVIVGLHHEQDMRRMGGLATKMPVTYITFVIGALALSAIPPFAGFYSKDAIIEATALSTIPGIAFAKFCVEAGAFITPLYIFRVIFLTFHGKFRGDTTHPVHESPWVILVPLILLAIPSIIAGGLLIGPMLFSTPDLLGNAIFILPQYNVLQELSKEFHGAVDMAFHAPLTLTFWLAIAGIATAWFFNLKKPEYAESLKKRFAFLYWIMVKKYGFDDFNQRVFVHGTRKLGNFFYVFVDLKMIDGIFVNGSGRLIRWFSLFARQMQTGYVYHYALVMIIGLAVFLGWFMLGMK